MSTEARLLDVMLDAAPTDEAPVPHVATVTAVTGSKLTLDYGNGVTGDAAHAQVKALVGDRVEVQVIGRQMVVTANYTHPVTDDARAEEALDLAEVANVAATQAQGSADAAANSAAAAAGAAATAEQHAQQAIGDAATAAAAAGAAQADATAAQASANAAKQAADRSLTQLSIVEDVSGTLNWIAEHGTYTATTDTTVHDGRVYFELVGGDYVPIASPDPTVNPSTEGWYVLDVTDSQTEYIMAHLAVTSRGLWVLPSGIGSETTPDTGETQADSDARQGDGYKVLLSSRGMTVYDGSGDAVATYGGSGISFAEDRPFSIGDDDAYVNFDGDGHISIGGAVTLGGKAQADLATTSYVQESIDGLEIGGRNLAIVGDMVRGYLQTGNTIEIHTPTSVNQMTTGHIPVTPGDAITIQSWITNTAGFSSWEPWIGYRFYSDESTVIGSRATKTGDAGSSYASIIGVTVPDGATLLRVSTRGYSGFRMKVERGNKATDWTEAPEDTSAAIGTANAKEQLIYKSAAAGTTTMSGTTTWVTDVTGGQATWTAVRPEYSSSYPVLFVATQRQSVSGAVTCTTPAIDKTTTVIDGGNIITNSITADQIAANTLTLGNMTAAAQADILNSNVQVGGRNLLLGTDVPLTMTALAANAYGVSPEVASVAADEVLTISLWAKASTSRWIDLYWASGSSYSNNESNFYPAFHLTTEWAKYTYTGIAGAGAATADNLRLRQNASEHATGTAGATIDVKLVKLERGTRPTDWTLAPEDVAASVASAVDGIELGGRNLLRKTGTLVTEDLAGSGTRFSAEDGVIRLTPTTNTAYAKLKVDYLTYDEYKDETLTLSFDARTTGDTTSYTDAPSVVAYVGYNDPSRLDNDFNSSYDAWSVSTVNSSLASTEWVRFSCTTDRSKMTNGTSTALASGSFLTVRFGCAARRMPLEIRRVKLERHDHATDWTPAPEDQSAYADGIVDSLADSMNQQFEANAEADAAYRANLEQQIQTLMDNAEAVQGRTQALKFDTTDGLTIGSKPLDEIESDFNINIKGEGLKFRYKQQVLATASGAGFDAPHLIAGTDLRIGGHWQWQEIDGRLVLLYV